MRKIPPCSLIPSCSLNHFWVNFLPALLIDPLVYWRLESKWPKCMFCSNDCVSGHMWISISNFVVDKDFSKNRTWIFTSLARKFHILSICDNIGAVHKWCPEFLALFNPFHPLCPKIHYNSDIFWLKSLKMSEFHKHFLASNLDIIYGWLPK